MLSTANILRGLDIDMLYRDYGPGWYTATIGGFGCEIDTVDVVSHQGIQTSQEATALAPPVECLGLILTATLTRSLDALERVWRVRQAVI